MCMLLDTPSKYCLIWNVSGFVYVRTTFFNRSVKSKYFFWPFAGGFPAVICAIKASCKPCSVLMPWMNRKICGWRAPKNVRIALCHPSVALFVRGRPLNTMSYIFQMSMGKRPGRSVEPIHVSSMYFSNFLMPLSALLANLVLKKLNPFNAWYHFMKSLGGTNANAAIYRMCAATLTLFAYCVCSPYSCTWRYMHWQKWK